MNETIADTLAQHFAALPFITRAAGCVFPVELAKNKIVPGASIVYKTGEVGPERCEPEAAITDLVPATGQTGILYFESEKEARVENSTRQRLQWKGSLKLVFWANLNNVSALATAGLLQRAIMSSTPTELPADGDFLGASIRIVREYSKHPHPFKKYSYEEERKYTTSPYCFFSLEIAYTSYSVNGCPVEVEIDPVKC